MIVTEKVDELRSFLDEARQEAKLVGLYPTRGALHGGHRSNIRKMAAECDVAAVTIYAGPLPFGPAEDPQAYLDDLDRDLAQAEEAGADIVFAPAQLFDDGPLVTVRVYELDQVLEGRRRPGHFDGVATIVAKLLSVAGPCYAYFGEVDYQQLVIVRRLVSDLSMPVVVVPCPTVREPDGLALSSRNPYLSPDERQVARALYWSLLAGRRAIEEQAVGDAGAVRAAMLDVVACQPLLDVDYAVVVDPVSLGEVGVVTGEVRVMVAGRIGRTRLIDNLAANAEEA